MSWFSFLALESKKTQLPDIFPIPISQRDFVEIDTKVIYRRILTDVVERTFGIPEVVQPLFWDNCLASEKPDGLLSMLSKAMAKKGQLYLVYKPDLKVIRLATSQEEQQIREDYKQRGESQIGIYVTFQNYDLTDMVKFYSQLEYCAVGSLWKQGNISKAIQLKLTDLRASIGVADSAEAKAQAETMAQGLKEGQDIMLDAKDMVELSKPDLTATNSMLDVIAQKRSFYLGMPSSYITGLLSGGLGDTGKGDQKAVERGLKGYYFSVIKPVVDGLFGVNTSFKSEDAEGLQTALQTLQTMDVTSDEYLSKENKTIVVNKAFGLDINERGDEPEAPVAQPLPPQPQQEPPQT